jgi:hypothetical protein
MFQVYFSFSNSPRSIIQSFTYSIQGRQHTPRDSINLLLHRWPLLSNRAGQYATRGVVPAVVQKLADTVDPSMKALQPEAPLSFTRLPGPNEYKHAAIDPANPVNLFSQATISASDRIRRYHLNLTQ